MQTLKAPRGTRDLLPPDTVLWNRVEATARAVFARYGFGEIRTPVFEATELFARGVGAETDIVSKEMYTWEDRARAASEKAQSLTLRPENTAGVVRAYIEHRLGDTGQLQKLFYIGPQFRRERPQRGRYRQFWQIGCEVLGPPTSGAESAIRDAEVLEMLASLLDELGVRGWQLELNSVGSSTDRPRYVEALRAALAPMKDTLCEDNRRRADTNPLRVLDSKAPEDQAAIDALPKIADYLDAASKDHFAAVLAALDACGVPYRVNPRLVRGLDYYTRTTFEFTVPDGNGLGTQNALLGGGRYDGLSEMLGGPRAPGIGFAIGADRLVLLLEAQRDAATSAAEAEVLKLDAYIAPLSPAQNADALKLARELRRAGVTVELGDGSFRLKKSFEAADRVARHILLLGEDEVAKGAVTIKSFRTGEQRSVRQDIVVSSLKSQSRAVGVLLEEEASTRFAELTRGLQRKFSDLFEAEPIDYASRVKKMPNRGVYLFSEAGKHLYVGRSNKLRSRWNHHRRGGHNSAPFAFKLARETTGYNKASYKASGETRKKLMQDPTFKEAFVAAQERIRLMDFRCVEEVDPNRQALLEIYCTLALGTPYNDFDNH